MKTIAPRAAIVTAAVYGYFLIFAQFAFVELLRSALEQNPHLEKAVLGVMALAGILSGFWVAWKSASPFKIRLGLGLGATASLAAPMLGNGVGFFIVAALTGSALGVATVSLATMLPRWCGLIWIGLGTGVGYACCNLPWVFLASPAQQAWIASGFAMIGALCVPSGIAQENDVRDGEVAGDPPFSYLGTLLILTALVWLDSAAFFIIQHADDLKSATWGGGMLWRNAGLHLSAAVVAGFWLKSAGSRWVPVTAWCLLAVAAMAVNHDSGRGLAGWLYPVGVSLYSAALVSWPGWFSGVSGEREVAWRAAWIYAVAGWFGSANGIGMAGSLQTVPVIFIAISGIAILGVLVVSKSVNIRAAVAVALVGLMAAIFPGWSEKSDASASERGRAVYISEGCIQCHSRYVRPNTRDEDVWGEAVDPADVLAEIPVLIGNRRQGPDLSQIGARRSSAWLKQHFMDPRAFSPGSVMASYSHLFESGKGDDLVAYLSQSGTDGIAGLIKKAAEWKPATTTADSDGSILFSNQCAVCHGEDGRGGGMMADRLIRLPANLVEGPFIWSPNASTDDFKVARIIKFGLPGTDMPGHELLSDPQINSLRNYVLSLRSAARK